MKKYLADGQEVNLLALTEHGAIVERIFEDFDGEGEINTDPELVDRVFDQPLTVKRQAELERIETELTGRRKMLAELESKISTVAQSNDALLKRFEKHKQLNRLIDFLDGKLTHYVRCDYSSVSITEAKTEVCSSSSTWEKELKLLCLFGSSKGDLTWKLNHYKDGSGSYHEVMPATSYEDALALAREHIQKRLGEADPLDEQIIESAKKFGVEIPSVKMRSYIERTVRERKSAIEKWRSDADVLEQKNAEMAKMINAI